MLWLTYPPQHGFPPHPDAWEGSSALVWSDKTLLICCLSPAGASCRESSGAKNLPVSPGGPADPPGVGAPQGNIWILEVEGGKKPTFAPPTHLPRCCPEEGFGYRCVPRAGAPGHRIAPGQHPCPKGMGKVGEGIGQSEWRHHCLLMVPRACVIGKRGKWDFFPLWSS